MPDFYKTIRSTVSQEPPDYSWTNTPGMRVAAVKLSTLGGSDAFSNILLPYQQSFRLMPKLGLSYGNKDQLLISSLQLNTSTSQRQ